MENFTQQPRRGVATVAETGRSCPYCRFPLKEGGEIVACGVCGAAHHADCWQDNSGCAVVACAGAGVEKTGPTLTPTPPPFAPPPPPPPAWPEQPQASGSGRNVMWLVGAVLLLSLAIGGVAVAMVLGGSSNGDQAASAPTPVPADRQASTTEVAPSSTEQGGAEATATAPTATAPETAPDVASDPQMNGKLPDVPRSTMRRDIDTMLTEYHQDIVDRRYRDAWKLLSERKRAKYEAEEGYAQWRSSQASLTPYLDPSGLSASIKEASRITGVARVKVTGMIWSDPKSTCSTWSGVTWVKYENESWTYDPGYSTTPSRRRYWEPLVTKTLGVAAKKDLC